MNRLALSMLAFTLAAWTVAGPAAAAPHTAASAVALGAAANGSTIELQGEAIGEPLRADAGTVWVNVLSGSAAIGVVVPLESAAAITQFGRYERVGDQVLVKGRFNVGCDEHGGEVDVHADSVEVVSPGRSKPKKPEVWKLAVSSGFIAAATLSAVRYRSARRRDERI